jgi:hypothetical protein
MSLAVQDLDSAPGDPHQRLVDEVRAGGPSRLAEELGDRAHELGLLTGIAQELFVPAERSVEAFRDVIGSLHAFRSALEALETHAVVALADSLALRKQAEARAVAAQEPGEEPGSTALLRAASREAAREVSMLTRRSPAAASHSLAARRRLVADMPVMLSALAESQVTAADAYRTSRSFAPLTSAQRREADRLLGERLPYLDGAGSQEWDDARAAAISLADPEGEARRHQLAKRERHVKVRRGEHGMATLSAHITALDAALIRKRLSLEAERLRAGGDRRGHQAIQADSFVNTLLGREGEMEPITLDIGVIITDRVLLDPGVGDLAQIEGYGTVPAEAVRESMRDPLDAIITADQHHQHHQHEQHEQCDRHDQHNRHDQCDRHDGRDRRDGHDGRDQHGQHDRCASECSSQDCPEDSYGPDGPALRAVLRRLYEHPRAPELVAIESHARAFPAALARFIRMRDRTCRGPHCNAPIRHIDHIQPHATEGPTSLDNGQGACAYCNDKEQQLKSVKRVGDPATDGHVVEWTTPLGTTRRTRPSALTHHTAQTPPSPDEAPDTPPTPGEAPHTPPTEPPPAEPPPAEPPLAEPPPTEPPPTERSDPPS